MCLSVLRSVLNEVVTTIHLDGSHPSRLLNMSRGTNYGDTGDISYGDTGDISYGDTGDISYGDTEDISYGDTGDINYGDTGDINYGDTGDINYGDTGDINYGDSCRHRRGSTRFKTILKLATNLLFYRLFYVSDNDRKTNYDVSWCAALSQNFGRLKPTTLSLQ